MKICGIQKLTLLDFPDHMACTIFTGGCNFRCPFCHNSSLVLGSDNIDTYSEDEILEFLKKRKGILDGVCVTGGEPTLQADLKTFIRKIKELGFLVKLDTNGYRPDVLIDLINSGLVDYVAVDIKNSIKNYPKTIGLSSFKEENLLKTIEFLINGSIEYEFRTTVVKEFIKKEDFKDIAELIKGTKRYYLQEFVASETCIKTNLHPYSREEMSEFIEILEKYNVKAYLRGI